MLNLYNFEILCRIDSIIEFIAKESREKCDKYKFVKDWIVLIWHVTLLTTNLCVQNDLNFICHIQKFICRYDFKTSWIKKK